MDMKQRMIHRTLARRVWRPLIRLLTRFGGKIRRAYLCLLRPKEVEKALELREGSCNNCGKCCQISFPCPFLKVYGSHAICKIYHLGRTAPCAAFPINRSDLADVDFECSYTFIDIKRPAGIENSRGLPVWNTLDSRFPEPGTSSRKEAFGD